MFCPRCGQRQVTNDARFCPACGFALNVVGELLATGGQLPWHPTAQTGGDRSSPRSRGVKQGAFLMLSTLVVVPVVIFLCVALLRMPGELIPLAAVVCVMGGLLRMLYAAFFESSVPYDARVSAPAQQYVPPAAPPNFMTTPHQPAALPPQQSAPAYRRPQRYNTGELVAPPKASVTDHTTRLLDKQPDEQPRE
jgi:hypothetical protein